ncbi:hypothetical protein EI555_013663 [Monodon monoceros]|uniref:Uncharacterized protein n=1 Tax=Monodon monoceros TaxID=40151 RepID=A0A4U1EPV4_MONMO|nr:hypothetical protein EI555_013663 [Monodon monoceros]
MCQKLMCLFIIPACTEINIPWLFFVNSFLIATVPWLECHKLTLRDIM